MIDHFKAAILNALGATNFTVEEKIQELWSGYGEILRVSSDSVDYPLAVIKHVCFPTEKNHPRGWNSDRSHKRKVRSYQVEMNFYKKYALQCLEHGNSPLPRCLGQEKRGYEVLMIFEDLDYSGYPVRQSSLGVEQMKPCLSWLAWFHATFMEQKPQELWKVGTYWHLDTRPDELKVLQDIPLREAACKLDQAHYPQRTLINNLLRLWSCKNLQQ